MRARMSGKERRMRALPLRKRMNMYMQLSKSKLSTLVLATTMSGFVMAPVPLDPMLLLYTSVGTGLTIASASANNQILEIEFDKLMVRTKGRVLPMNKLTREHAIAFSSIIGVLGTGILYTQVNPLAAGLAAGNILLYSYVYTPMKRATPFNTWVGSIVGAVPPMIGWVAATGSGLLDPGCLALGYLLFAWQIPHFLSLSYFRRLDYKLAGYKMLSHTDIQRVPKASLLYSYYLLPFGTVCYLSGLTQPDFILGILPLQGYLLYYAQKFHQQPNDQTARKLFRSTLLFLPLVMILMYLRKAPNPAQAGFAGVDYDGEIVDRPSLGELPFGALPQEWQKPASSVHK